MWCVRKDPLCQGEEDFSFSEKIYNSFPKSGVGIQNLS